MNATTLAKLLQETQWLTDAVRDAYAEHLEQRGLAALDRRLLGLLELKERPVTTRLLARRLLRPLCEIDAHLRALRERGWVVASTAQGTVPASFQLSAGGRRELAAVRRAERELAATLEVAIDDPTARATIVRLRALRGRLSGTRQRGGRPRRRPGGVAGEVERPRRALEALAGLAGAAGA